MASGVRVLIPAVVAAAVLATAGEPSGGGPTPSQRRVRLANYALNSHIRLLDGQWQGTILASDGNVYLGGGSHNPELGAALFRYEPVTKALRLLVPNITLVCGEDPAKTPPQGKIHSPVVEHEGWLYFGTHLANYTEAGRKAYTGAHLLGYQLATGKFRDFGVIHPNFTNYSALGLDPRRGCIYFYVTPFYEGEGSRLYRVDIASGAKHDMGLVARWTHREDHGPPSYHCFVDARGDCWLTARYERTLYVGRAASGKVEAHPDALPAAAVSAGSRDPWKALRPLDEDRALVLMAGKMWVFDSRKAPRGEGTFTPLCDADPTQRLECFAYGGGRFYWTLREKPGAPLRLMSAAVERPTEHFDHGEITDSAGRTPMWAGDLITDGQGTVYMVGRWSVTEADMQTIGVLRHNQRMAVFLSVMDVCDDLRALGAAGGAGEGAQAKAPLALDLPKPHFIGTPIHLKSPNLEKPRQGKRPDLLVPVGVTNLALKKPVTASDSRPIMGELSQVTDGDKDGVEGSYVEIGPGKQWFQVDLGQRCQLFAIVVWHYHAQARVYHDVVVQVSDDPAFARGVRTLYNNDHDNSSGLGIGKDKEYIDSHEGLLIDAGGVEARYVRLWGNGNTENDLNHCTEIEVYGKGASGK